MRNFFLQPVHFVIRTILVFVFFAFATADVSAQCILPAKPGSITGVGGNTKVCPGSTKSYSIKTVIGATSYLWTPPAGANIASGQGSLSVTVDYTAGFTANDTLKVAAVNACGTGPNQMLLISRNNPPLTGAFTGPATGFCNLSGVAYSVPDIANVIFNWSFDVPGATITSGLGTHAITVDFTPAFNIGILGVSTTNTCGTSGEHHLHMKASPAAPAVINGTTTICANQQAVPYSIAPISIATSYTWTGPSGSRISDGVHTSTSTTLTTSASSVTVNFAANGGALKVRGNSVCGSGSFKSVTIAVNCREEQSNAYINDKVFCYPVPANDHLNISFTADKNQSVTILLFDITGNTLSSKTYEALNGENTFTLDVSSYARGIYLLKVIEANKTIVRKITMQ